MKRKPVMFLLAALLIAGLALTGCTKPKEPAKPTVPQVINYNLGAEPETLDSAKATGDVEFTTIYALFEGLASLNEKFEPVPGMAESWDVSPDGTVYTFKIRKDARWTNGDPVTAGDFAYAWERVLNPATAADYAYQLYYIKNGAAYNAGEITDASQLGIEVVDEHTLRVTLEAPAPQFLQLMAFPTFFPVHKPSVEAAGDGYGGEAEGLVTNGPFKLAKWEHRSVLELVPNDDYWNRQKVKPEQLIFYTVEDETTELSMYETGEIDLADNPPLEELDRLEAEGKLTVDSELAIYYYVFNTAKEPFDDVRVRKAFTMAVDRQALVDLLKGGRKPARAYTPYGIINPTTGKDFRTEDVEEYFQDNAEQARALLKEAGYEDPKDLGKIEILYNTSAGHKTIAEFIQQQWATNLGIPSEQIVPYNQEWQVYLTTRDEGNFQVARAGWGADYMDPMTFLDMYMADSGNNDTNWSDAEYDRLLGEAKNTGDQNVRFANMHAAEKILMEAMPVMPLYFYTDLYVRSPNLKGGIGFPFGPRWDFTTMYKE